MLREPLRVKHRVREIERIMNPSNGLALGFELPVEAAAVPGMAGRADLGDFYKDRIIVAVNTHLLQVLEMTACQSLYP